MSAEFLAVRITTGSEAEAEAIAAALIERRLAACAQVWGPLLSTYRWQGALEREREWVCEAKTSSALFAEVEAAIRELHSYEEPEIVATAIVAGSEGYLDWLGANLGPG